MSNLTLTIDDLKCLVSYHLEPEERQKWDHPGRPEHIEIESIEVLIDEKLGDYLLDKIRERLEIEAEERAIERGRADFRYERCSRG